LNLHHLSSLLVARPNATKNCVAPKYEECFAVLKRLSFILGKKGVSVKRGVGVGVHSSFVSFSVLCFG